MINPINFKMISMKTAFILITQAKNGTNITLKGSNDELTSLLEDAVNKNTDFGDAFIRLIIREFKRQKNSTKKSLL